MAHIKLTDVMRPFDGNGCVIEWLEKFELIGTLKKLSDQHVILPMFLEGSALTVYAELSVEQKASTELIKTALKNAFSINPFQAYENFMKRTWRDEPVDVYMTELRKLARLAEITSDALLRKAFVVGLPAVVSRELRAMKGIETMALSEIVERSRALMSELIGKPTVVAAVVDKNVFDKQKYVDRSQVKQVIRDERRCFGCGGPHLVRQCQSRNKETMLRCWTCGGIGHVASQCPSTKVQGNERGRTFAPEVLPEQE